VVIQTSQLQCTHKAVIVQSLTLVHIQSLLLMVPLRHISTRPQAQLPPHTHVPLQNEVKVFPHAQMGHRHCDMAHMSLVPAMPPVRMAGTATTVPPFPEEQATRLPTNVRFVINSNWFLALTVILSWWTLPCICTVIRICELSFKFQLFYPAWSGLNSVSLELTQLSTKATSPVKSYMGRCPI